MMLKLKQTFSILSHIRHHVEMVQKKSVCELGIEFTDMTYHAEGARVLITDKKDGQKYELLLRPIELAKGNTTIPRSFGEAKEY